jgi:hypothetical protein
MEEKMSAKDVIIYRFVSYKDGEEKIIREGAGNTTFVFDLNDKKKGKIGLDAEDRIISFPAPTLVDVFIPRSQNSEMVDKVPMGDLPVEEFKFGSIPIAKLVFDIFEYGYRVIILKNPYTYEPLGENQDIDAEIVDGCLTGRAHVRTDGKPIVSFSEGHILLKDWESFASWMRDGR